MISSLLLRREPFLEIEGLRRKHRCYTALTEDVCAAFTMPVTSETIAVRKGEELNIAVLTEYLKGKIEGAEHGILVEQFPAGHSNLSYVLRAGRHEYVLRRAPVGPLPPKAHDMEREFRVLQAVHPRFPEAPRPYLLCNDPSVTGAVFFLMERRRGFILNNTIPDAIACQPGHAQRIGDAVIDCLARLHAIPVEGDPSFSFGRPDGFVSRQVRGWGERWRNAATEELPVMDEVIRWLVTNLPASNNASLVHNDYKLDNVVLSRTDIGSVEAVLDWEMATVGEPIADLGLLLCYWATAPRLRGTAVSQITVQPGWYGRDALVERYALRTGRDLEHLPYYEVLGVFKLAVIIQQIYARYRRGQTKDDRFGAFGDGAKKLVATAARMAEVR